MKKRMAAIMISAFFVLSACSVSAASVQESAFPSYGYSLWGDVIDCPAPYTQEGRVTGADLGLSDFRQINDLFASPDGRVFAAVSGNEPEDNRIIILDRDLNLLETASGYSASDGSFVPFSEPLGVFVDSSLDIYICDGKTKNVLHLDPEFHEKLVIPPPSAKTSKIIKAEFTERYRPSKLAVDKTGRIHVVASNVNEGIVEFEADGTFTGFLAAGKVKYSTLELLWRRFSTAVQRSRMKDFVPVEYNNIELDSDGYLFATMAAADENAVRADIASNTGSDQGTVVRRLNYQSNDIMERNGNGPIVGDLAVLDRNLAGYTGISRITDVAAGANGSFFLLDSNRSHIFAYSQDGNLLYAFAGPDVTAGGMRMPVAITFFGDCLYAADTGTRSVTVYKQTGFAKAVDTALAAESSGSLEEARLAWEAVLEQSAGYALAYTGLGKIAYQSGDYETAMHYFEACQNSRWYSKAFKQYRSVKAEQVLIPVLIAAAVLAAAVGVPLLVHLVKKQRKKKRNGKSGV